MIVISIVSVLVAVAIPVFSTQLEKAREATDLANMRDAKAAAVAMYLDDNENAGTYYWDAEKGTLVADKTGVNGYGKGTAKIGSSSNRFFDSTQEVYNAGVDCNGRIIKVIITDPEAANLNATIALSWDGATVVPSTPTEPSSSEEEPEEPPVVQMATIKAGTYKFISAPQAPSSTLNANLNFTFNYGASEALAQIQVNSTSLIYSDGSMGFYAAYNFPGAAWSTDNTNIDCITISSNAEVPEAFYTWFNANVELYIRLYGEIITLPMYEGIIWTQITVDYSTYFPDANGAMNPTTVNYDPAGNGDEYIHATPNWFGFSGTYFEDPVIGNLDGTAITPATAEKGARYALIENPDLGGATDPEPDPVYVPEWFAAYYANYPDLVTILPATSGNDVVCEFPEGYFEETIALPNNATISFPEGAYVTIVKMDPRSKFQLTITLNNGWYTYYIIEYGPDQGL